MRLRYTLSRCDLFRAGARAMLRQRFLLIILIPILTFVWWSTFTWDENRGETLPLRITVATLAAGMCAGTGILAGVLMVAAQSFLRRDKGVVGEHTLEITDDGLIESTEVNRSLANWRTSFRIRESKRYAHIYTSLGSAHVVPKAKPPLEGSVVEFLGELKARIKTSQQGAPPSSGLESRNGKSGVSEGPPSVS